MPDFSSNTINRNKPVKSLYLFLAEANVLLIPAHLFSLRQLLAELHNANDSFFSFFLTGTAATQLNLFLHATEVLNTLKRL